MKQLATKLSSIATVDENAMLADYWAINIINDIEEFVFSDREFLNKYSNTIPFFNLNNIETFAVYNVNECSVCLKSFNVIINDRIHLREYNLSNTKYCRICAHFKSSIENLQAEI